MPEGDSAWRAAHHLHRALAGRTVDRFELRMPNLAVKDLRGAHIHGAEARGKHMLLRIDDYTVHSHFGMDGSWRLVPPPGSQARPGRRGPTVAWPAEHRIRAIVGTDAAVALGIDLARLELWPTADEREHLGYLGPDLLAEEPDLEDAARRILAEPTRPITGALLDQRNVAGLGNEYVTEMCFIRGVLPTRSVAEAGEVHEWLELGRRLLLANRDRVERTFTGNLRDRNWVFSRGGEPCKRCGTTILEGKHDSGSRQRGAQWRDSTWCPSCQG